MGQPVVHFEIIGQDGDALRSYYSELFGWEFDANNPMKYGIVAREDNLTDDGVGIGGGRGGGAGGVPRATSRSTSRCPTWRPRSRRPRAWAGRA